MASKKESTTSGIQLAAALVIGEQRGRYLLFVYPYLTIKG